MVNAANAQAVYDFLTAHPTVHAQSDWVAVNGVFPNEDTAVEKKAEQNFCGTTLCAAGAAVWVVEGKRSFRQAVRDFNDPEDLGDEGPDSLWVTRGAEILGISTSDADRLFYNMNNESALVMLKAVADDDMDAFDAEYHRAMDSDEYYG